MKNRDPDSVAPAPAPRRSADTPCKDLRSTEPAGSCRPPVKRPSRRPRTAPKAGFEAMCQRWRRGSIAAFAALWTALPLTAAAQNYEAMLRQSIDEMNRNIARGQQLVDDNLRQRIRDPRAQASYAQYVAQMRSRGQPAMDYPSYTYRYIDTRGFTPDGIAYSRSVDAGIQANERAAVQGLRDAQAARGAAQQAQRDGYLRNQQEAGRGLMGQSSYVTPNGAALQLPHTWQKNSTQQYRGQTYRVDHAGQYHVLGSNGWWYPLSPR